MPSPYIAHAVKNRRKSGNRYGVTRLLGYSQWQVTDDSGSDVTWSKSIHDQGHAIGPEVNLAVPSKTTFLTFRYLREFHVVDSPEGQLMALTLTKRF